MFFAAKTQGQSVHGSVHFAIAQASLLSLTIEDQVVDFSKIPKLQIHQKLSFSVSAWFLEEDPASSLGYCKEYLAAICVGLGCDYFFRKNPKSSSIKIFRSRNELNSSQDVSLINKQP